MNELNIMKKLVRVSLLVGLGIILNMIQIPYPFASFLKIDISEVVVLIALIYGLKEAIAVSGFKFLIMLLLHPSDIIGTVIMFIGSLIIIFSYNFIIKVVSKKIALVFMGFVFVFFMVLLNYFIFTPLYSGMHFSEMNTKGYLVGILILYVPFNLIKISIISIIFYILDKRIKWN